MAFEIHTDGLLNIINSDLCNFDLGKTRKEKMRLHLPKREERAYKTDGKLTGYVG